MKNRPGAEETPCVEYANIYQHPLIDGSLHPESGAQRREQAMLLNQATRLCGSCPLMKTCLTEAVVQFDVAGFTAGTTEAQRDEIRAHLGIAPESENFDAYAGTRSSRQVDPDEIYRLRMSNPNASLRTIAERLECSVSTVKRHLRRLRAEEGNTSPASVTPDQVWEAREMVLGDRANAA